MLLKGLINRIMAPQQDLLLVEMAITPVNQMMKVKSWKANFEKCNCPEQASG